MPSESQSTQPKQIFVQANDGHAEDKAVEVFGPFDNQSVASAYVIDLANDNGWTAIEVVSLTESEAAERSTHGIRDPYKK